MLLEKAPTFPMPCSGWDSSSHNLGWNEWNHGHIIDRSTAKVVQLALVRPLTAWRNQGLNIPGPFLGTLENLQSYSCPARVGVCAHHIVQQRTAGHFWVILTLLAKDATEAHMRNADGLSFLLGPISSSYISKVRSVHMWGQVVPVIICIKIEEYMWQAWN